MSSYIRKAFRWLLLAPVVLPLIYVDGLLYPYLAPKTLLLRAFGILAVAIFAYCKLSGAPMYWQRMRGVLSWIPGALLVVAYLTSLAGVDFYTSFWSTFERGDGLLTLSIVIAYFYMLLLTVEESFVTTLYKVVAWVSSIVAVHALLQWVASSAGIGIPLIYATGDRIGGSLGNPAFLASYLGLSVLVTLAAAKLSAGRSQAIVYIGAALQLLAIVLTATRGTLLALGVVGIAVLIFFALNGSSQIKKYARGGLLAIVIAAGLFFAFRSQLSQTSFVPVQRLASVSLSDATVSSRLFLWKNLTKEGFAQPLMGVGAEHVGVLFDKVYDPSQITEQWFDRSHNSYLDYFLQFGIVGFALYAALVLSALYLGWVMYVSGGRNVLFGLTMFGVGVVYAIQNMFVFDTSMVLWLFLALLASTLALREGGSKSVLFTIPQGGWVGAVLGVAIALLLYPVFIQPLRANMYLSDAYAHQIENVQRSVDSMQKGLALGTYANLEYGYQAYQMYASGQISQLNGTQQVDAYRNAKQILEANAQRYAYDARTLTYYAHILDVAPAGEEPSEEKVLEVLADATSLSPKRTQPWYLKANIYIQEGDKATTKAAKISAYAQAIDVLKEYLTAVPSASEPRYVIATLYLVLGDTAMAKQWADEGLALYNGNADQASRAVKYYIATEDWTHAAQFLQDIVDEYPTDYDSWYDLAKASYLAGNAAKAKEIVAMLRKAKPGFVESDQAFLRALGE